jgi:hypothetical protein
MFSPFSLFLNPMKRLFLINFEKDADEIYIGFEPQWFDDPNYGTGLRIIAWRKDGFVDVYQQPGLTVEKKIDVAAKGLADTCIVPLTNARFNVTKSGIDVAFKFEDKSGRTVEVEIVEKSQKPTHPFSLLAPVGSSSLNPSSLPVYFMFEFDFVRKKHTVVNININGRSHQADPFAFPMNGSRVYYMRYSADTFLVDWCPAQSQCIEPLTLNDNRYLGADDIWYDIIEVDKKYAIASLHASRNNHQFNATFNPPFPELTFISDQSSYTGDFVLGSDESVGEVCGGYTVSRAGDVIEVTLNPNRGWEPRPKTFFLKFLFTVVKMFRQWPKTYLWKAQIKLDHESLPYITSNWMRI